VALSVIVPPFGTILAINVFKNSATEPPILAVRLSHFKFFRKYVLKPLYLIPRYALFNIALFSPLVKAAFNSSKFNFDLNIDLN